MDPVASSLAMRAIRIAEPAPAGGGNCRRHLRPYANREEYGEVVTAYVLALLELRRSAVDVCL